MTRIVETITADTMAELRARRDRVQEADLVELRLDGVRDLDVAGALAGRTLPVIVTCRPAWEGGRFDGGEGERRAILTAAARLGAEYVDVEWKAGADLVAACSASRCILSHHDFDGVPSDLSDRVRAMRAMDAEVVKVAVMARSLRDCVRLKHALAGDTNHVALAMGTAGLLTRLWPAWIGSLWTYGGTAAPGQIPVRDLIHRYRARTSTMATRAFGVAGRPILHSASPAMHNAAFAAIGRDAVYLPLETACADELLAVADELGLDGVSVTIPLKQALCQSPISLDATSRQIGAVNTLRRGPAGWEGRNFDVAGFLAPLQARRIPLGGRRACVLGAGGSARAVVAALAGEGADVGVSARRRAAAEDLAKTFGVRAIAWPPASDWDLLVNTTPVGMWPQVAESPLAPSALREATGRLVYDLVYNPRDTHLLAQARAAGATTIDGLEMLMSQACRQFEWWTGADAPEDVMAAAAESAVADARSRA
jgi:3-dehydroquinate dehydratase/shikimate dehydrogenase